MPRTILLLEAAPGLRSKGWSPEHLSSYDVEEPECAGLDQHTGPLLHPRAHEPRLQTDTPPPLSDVPARIPGRRRLRLL